LLDGLLMALGVSLSFWRQFGQYQGAGVLTGFGLILRHLAHRKRWPFTAIFGRAFFPVLRMFLSIGTSSGILSECRHQEIDGALDKNE
jgi:hypothetical protein